MKKNDTIDVCESDQRLKSFHQSQTQHEKNSFTPFIHNLWEYSTNSSTDWKVSFCQFLIWGKKNTSPPNSFCYETHPRTHIHTQKRWPTAKIVEPLSIFIFVIQLVNRKKLTHFTHRFSTNFPPSTTDGRLTYMKKELHAWIFTH